MQKVAIYFANWFIISCLTFCFFCSDADYALDNTQFWPGTNWLFEALKMRRKNENQQSKPNWPTTTQITEVNSPKEVRNCQYLGFSCIFVYQKHVCFSPFCFISTARLRWRMKRKKQLFRAFLLLTVGHGRLKANLAPFSPSYLRILRVLLAAGL